VSNSGGYCGNVHYTASGHPCFPCPTGTWGSGGILNQAVCKLSQGFEAALEKLPGLTSCCEGDPGYGYYWSFLFVPRGFCCLPVFM
jgi:hypothetical protein